MKTKIENAIRYATLNPTLSFHHVAKKYGVDVHDLQREFAKRYNAGKVMV